MRSVKPSLVLRRLIHPLYRKLETDVHPLRYLFAEITRRCNLACRHCGSDCSRHPAVGELSLSEWTNFFAYLKNHFDPRHLIVVLTGGEPLCHPHFEPIIASLAANRLDWGMVTNGWSLDRDRARMIAGHGISSLTVSLDGLGPSHDWLRGRAGSFDRALRAIDEAVAARVPLFDVVTCVNPSNLSELGHLQNILEDHGVKQWRLFMIFPKGRARDNSDLVLNDDEVKRLMEWIAAARRDAGPGGMLVEFSCEGYFPARVDREVRNEPYFCRAGICIGGVLSDGAITACPNISRELCQGNIRTHDFKSVWENEFKPLRDRSWMKTGPCGDCRQWKRCQGNSLHLWDDQTRRTGRCYFDLWK